MLTQEERIRIKQQQGEANGPSPKSDAIISRYDDAGALITASKTVEARAARIANVATIAPGVLEPAALLARIEALEAKATEPGPAGPQGLQGLVGPAGPAGQNAPAPAPVNAA